MPCRDDWSVNDSSFYRGEAVEAGRAACDLSRVVRESLPRAYTAKVFKLLSPSTLAWIEKHDREDAYRIKKEQEEAERKKAIAKAKAKLTKEEKILGMVEIGHERYWRINERLD